MTPTISIRPYRPADLEAVLELLRVSLGESEVNQRTPALFSWKHVDNPFGGSIMLVAEDSIGIAGFRAFLRWELATMEGEVIRCVRPVDTATHPRAQRQGIFRNLTLEAVEVARGEGVDLIFNTPNPRSKAGYLTMGWVEVGRIGVLVRPKFGGLFGRTPSLPSVSGATVWNDQIVVDRAPLGLRTPRTAQYVGWRFRHPFARYLVTGNAEGMAILRPNNRKERKELVVSDLSGPRAGQALRQAVRGTDADYLIGWFAPRSPERRQAQAAGMTVVPGMTALTVVGRPLRPDLSWAIDGMKHWDLSLSDLELM